MRAQNAFQGAGEIIFPLFLYYLLNMAVPFCLELMWKDFFLETEVLWILALTNCCLIPVFARMYQRERLKRDCRFPERKYAEQAKQSRRRRKYGFCEAAFAILGAVCISRGINLVLGLTFLPRYFPGYETAQAEIYKSSLLSQIAASVISAPLLEELLMRGVIYNRILRMCSSVKAAVVGSTLIFGLFHGNVVQGIYAFCLGLFFAQVYEWCNSLVPAVLAHGAANGFTLLTVYLPFFRSGPQSLVLQELAAAVYLLLGAFFWRKFRYLYQEA